MKKIDAELAERIKRAKHDFYSPFVRNLFQSGYKRFRRVEHEPEIVAGYRPDEKRVADRCFGVKLEYAPMEAVLSACDGEIWKAENGRIILRRADDFGVVYEGLGPIFVSAGDIVRHGQEIGWVEENDDKKHILYFEMRYDYNCSKTHYKPVMRYVVNRYWQQYPSMAERRSQFDHEGRGKNAFYEEDETLLEFQRVEPKTLKSWVADHFRNYI